MTLTATGVNSGVFVSPYLLLVSNTADDTHAVDGKADNTLDDRTLKVKLGDMVGMTYWWQEGALITKQAPVRVIKTVNVHITSMTNKQIGAPGADNFEADAYARQTPVNEWMERANEQYAHVGVRLVWTIQFADQPVSDLPGGTVDLETDGLSEFGAIPASITPEERALIRGKRANNTPFRTPETNDLELFIVNYLSNGSRCEAFPEEWLRGVENQSVVDLMDTVIVSWRDKRPFTIPHEIGHMLLNWKNHYEDEFPAALPEWVDTNLMRGGGTSATDAVMASKRLRQVQQTEAHNNRPNLIEDYIP